MPYDLDPVPDDPVSESARKERLRNLKNEQARTLREKLGDELYDWLDDLCDDMKFLGED